MIFRLLPPCASAVFVLLSLEACQPREPAPPESDMVRGPVTAKLGTNIAQIEVPEGWIFLGPARARDVLVYLGNRPSPDVVGMLVPDRKASVWWLLLEFHAVGYVKGNDRIDAKALLAAIRKGTESTNPMRAKKSISPVHVTGWFQEPHYDRASHLLVWGIEGRQEDGQRTLNYNFTLLGRKGYLSAIVVAEPSDMAVVKRDVMTLLRGLSYRPGNRYAEFASGDKVADGGLGHLIAGGPDG